MEYFRRQCPLAASQKPPLGIYERSVQWTHRCIFPLGVFQHQHPVDTLRMCQMGGAFWPMVHWMQVFLETHVTPHGVNYKNSWSWKKGQQRGRETEKQNLFFIRFPSLLNPSTWKFWFQKRNLNFHFSWFLPLFVFFFFGHPDIHSTLVRCVEQYTPGERRGHSQGVPWLNFFL
jgi:hypothetical protein